MSSRTPSMGSGSTTNSFRYLSAPLASSRRSSSFSSLQISDLSGACRTCNIEVVKWAIQQKKPVAASTFTEACATSNIEIIKAVEEAGAMPDAESLDMAFISGIEEIVRKALWKGARPSSSTAQNAQSTVDRRIIDLLALVPPPTGSQGSLPKLESSELTSSSSDGSSSQMGLSRSTSSNLSRKTAERSTSESAETETVRRGKSPSNLHVAVDKSVALQPFALFRAVESRDLSSVTSFLDAGASAHGTAEAQSELTAACYARSSAIFETLRKRCMGLKPDSETLSAAFSSGIWDLVKLAVSAGAKANEQTLNKAILAFIRDNERALDAVNIALGAGAKATDDTIDIALRHCDELNAPDLFILHLRQKSEAQLSASSLSWAAKCSHKDPAAYAALLDTLVSIGAKPDEGTFRSIRWVTIVSEERRPIFLPTKTVAALFKAGLQGTEGEIAALGRHVAPVTTVPIAQTDAERSRVAITAFYKEIAKKARANAT